MENNEQVTVHFTKAQWNLLFHMLNSYDKKDELLRAGITAAHMAGEYIGSNPGQTYSRILSQLINCDHPALYTDE